MPSPLRRISQPPTKSPEPADRYCKSPDWPSSSPLVLPALDSGPYALFGGTLRVPAEPSGLFFVFSGEVAFDVGKGVTVENHNTVDKLGSSLLLGHPAHTPRSASPPGGIGFEAHHVDATALQRAEDSTVLVDRRNSAQTVAPWQW